MRIAALLAALFLLASPAAARAAVPAASCPDILVGDSLAVGMGPYARAAGFEVIARTGIGLSWLRAQNPRCARRVVVVVGTNDLRGIDPWSAEAYPERLAAIMGRWQAQQIVWATPGCFPYDQSLERGSAALDRALAREPLVRVGGRREYMRVHSGRTARCGYLSGDGIHPTGAGYRAWWASLSQAIGPAPDDRYREARAAPPAASARASVRSVPQFRQARSARTTRSVQQAQAVRPGRSTQVARLNAPVRPGQQAGSARLAQQARVARATQPARAAPATRSAPRQAPPDRQVRSAQQARPMPHARPGHDARPLRLPAPPGQASGTPIRRT
ncbi:hypothetical protein EJV46_03875 [Roseococcus sp. SYP-B2431]|uniref:SGNH/GDSL hydrolase family protein n=1 Tax=Roseococcus sp. SYP-B2431 TaxID=2496640 RepID=UPI00103924A5|nr:SGNH/GDSL hydrolase family protein [Roseococcus sp. SYP-B2431]TCH99817.1 hypothetical protein EJV46_03875 [Roseococcus sp. SYP-B2431]